MICSTCYKSREQYQTCDDCQKSVCRDCSSGEQYLKCWECKLTKCCEAYTLRPICNFCSTKKDDKLFDVEEEVKSEDEYPKSKEHQKEKEEEESEPFEELKTEVEHGKTLQRDVAEEQKDSHQIHPVDEMIAELSSAVVSEEEPRILTRAMSNEQPQVKSDSLVQPVEYGPLQQEEKEDSSESSEEREEKKKNDPLDDRASLLRSLQGLRIESAELPSSFIPAQSIISEPPQAETQSVLHRQVSYVV